MHAQYDDLSEWRARTLRLVMIVGAASGLPAYVSVIYNSFSQGQLSPILWLYTAGYLWFAGLLFLRGIEAPVRAGMFMAASYLMAIASFARVGLAGSGRLYLVLIPAIAFILIGIPAGYVCLGISLALFGGFAFLAHVGLLARWMTVLDNPVNLGFWVEAGIALAVFLLTLATLLDLFTAKHMRTLAMSHRVARDLEKANASLERRMQERGREMDLLNSVAAMASGRSGLEEIVRVCLERTLEAFGLEAGGAYGLDETSGNLVLLAHKGLSDVFIGQTSRLDPQSVGADRRLNLELPLSWAVADHPSGPLKEYVEAEGLKRIVGVPLVAKAKVVGGIILNTREDRVLSEEEESLLVAVGQQIGLAIENARLLELERAQHAEAHRRQLVAEGLRETLAVLNSDSPLPQTLSFIISQACRLMQADASSLFQLEEPGGYLTIRASFGLSQEYARTVRFKVGEGGAGRALANRAPVALPDAEAALREMRKSPGAESPPDIESVEQMLRTTGYRAILSVPLIVQNEGYGGITLYYCQPRRFTDEEVQLATSLGVQAAMAIENSRLRERAGRSAAVEERNRLARELHDSVAQSLYSVTLYAEAAARLVTAGETADVAEHLRELGTTARDALREMRLLIFELSPPALEKSSLADAIQARLDAVESRGGMAVQLQVEGTERLGRECRQELYQVAQEALNNALKHSRARTVRILLEYGEQETRLSIRDDGVGIRLEQAQKGGGLGLRSMRERAERLGGTLSVEPSPTGGTVVTVTAPAHGEPAGPAVNA